MEDREAIYIGNVIIVLRKARFMRQEDLATDSGIGRHYMYMIENNKSEPGLGTIFDLADALGMKASELVKIIEESPDTVFTTKKRRNSEKNK